MKIGSTFNHEVYGPLKITKKRYSRMGNKSLWIGVDENGEEHELDGTEKPAKMEKESPKFLKEAAEVLGMAQGPKGEDADEDYIIEAVIPRVLEQIRQPENGKDGADADVELIIREMLPLVMEKMPRPKELNEALIIQKVVSRIRIPQDGKPGEKGKDGSPDTPAQVKDKLESLEGDDRLDAKAIKNLPKQSTWSGGGGIKRIDAANDTRIISPTNGQTLVWNSTRQVWENSSEGYKNIIIVGMSNADYICDGTDDDVQIQEALDACVVAGGGTVLVKSGTYDITSTLVIQGSNVKIIGEGSGATKFILNASVPDNLAQIIKVIPSNTAQSYALTADSAAGDLSLTLDPVDAAHLVAGDIIILRSNLDIDTENTGRKQGDLYKVKEVTSGTVTLGSSGNGMSVHEAFTMANGAAVDKLTFYENIHIEGIGFSDAAISRSNAMVNGQNYFYYVDNLTIKDCQFESMFYSGIRVFQCWNVKITGNDFRDIKDTTPSQNTYYGVELRGASINLEVSNNTFHNMRHGVTQGAGGTDVLAGRTRNIVIANNSSSATTTAHFDLHQGAETVTISGNTMTSDDGGANGIQARSACSIIGNTILGSIGTGVSLFGAASGSVVTGNYIKGCSSGIIVDVGVTDCLIANNIITQTGNGYPIHLYATGSAHGGDDCIISGNYIYGNSVTTYGIVIDSASNVLVNGNKLKCGTVGRILSTHVVGTNVVFMNNFCSGLGGTPFQNFSASSTHILKDNFGYNLKGAGGATIATPFPTGTGNVMNYPSTNAVPDSGVLYTNVHSTKNYTVSGGTVSAIEINGISAAILGGAFKLGIGDTIKVTYSVAPTVVVKIA